MSVITTYKAITDLPSLGTLALTGTDVIEATHAPLQNGATSVQVTVNQLAKAIASTGSIAIGAELIIGSPQGTLTTNAGQFAFDTAGQALWLNLSSSGSNSWIQLI